MHRQHLVRVTTEGSSYRVTLPRALANNIGIQRGDTLAAVVVGQCLVLMPVADAVNAKVVATTNALLDQLMPVRG